MQSTCFQWVVLESPCGEGKNRKLAECVCERARLHARGMAEGEKSGGARGEKSCGVFSESGHICRESAPFFFVGRAFVSWGARRVARGCGKMSHAGVEIGGALRLHRARGAHCVENCNFAA